MLFSLLFELALDARQVDPHALVLYPSRGRERWPVPMPTKGGILTLFTSISRLSAQTPSIESEAQSASSFSTTSNAVATPSCLPMARPIPSTMGVCARKGCSVRRSLSALEAGFGIR